MKMPKNLLVPALIVLVIAVIAVIWLSGSGKTLVGVSKDSCDYKFLQWCKDNPKVGDYDNFANAQPDCEFEGSYRTCEQVTNALS